MGQMRLPAGTDLAAEVLRLNAELENTRKELVAERAKVVDLEMRLGASSEVLSCSVIRDLVGAPLSLPVALVSYLNEPHRKRGRRSFAAQVPVVRGLAIENHERIWRNLNTAIDSKVEASRIVTALSDYQDSLIGLSFSAEEKQRIVSNLLLLHAKLGLQVQHRDVVGNLSVNEHSLRIQMCIRRPNKKAQKTFYSLGTVFPALKLVPRGSQRGLPYKYL